MRIRILIKEMQICNTGLQTLHGSFVNLHGSPWLYSEPPQLPADYSDADSTLNYDKDPDPHFYFNADPVSYKDADPQH